MKHNMPTFVHTKYTSTYALTGRHKVTLQHFIKNILDQNKKETIFEIHVVMFRNVKKFRSFFGDLQSYIIFPTL